ncbi:unnamed protein product, partial [Rotaria magnacalcarata]
SNMDSLLKRLSLTGKW